MRIASLLMFQLLICPTDNLLMSGHTEQKWCVVKCTKILTFFPLRSCVILSHLICVSTSHCVTMVSCMETVIKSLSHPDWIAVFLQLQSLLPCNTWSLHRFCLLHQGESSYEYSHSCFSEELWVTLVNQMKEPKGTAEWVLSKSKLHLVALCVQLY